MESIEIAKQKALALASAKFKLKQKDQQFSMNELASGPAIKPRAETQFGVRGTRTQKAQKTDELSFYKEHLPKALMVNEDEIDLTSGAPVGLRAGYDFLPTMSDKRQALSNKFGEENVKALNISGEQNLLYKDEGKWKFFDLPFGVEFADVTSDLAGDVAPTVASIAAVIPAIVSTPAGMAVAGSLAYGGVGSLQDYAARKAFGLEAEKMEIAKRRGLETALGAGLDWGLMKGAGMLARGVLRKEGMDIAAQQLKAVEDKIKLPIVMKEGEEGVQKVMDAANIYKDGTAAKFLEGVRDQVNWQFTGETVDPEPVINKFAQQQVKGLLDDLDKLNKSVNEVAEKKAVIDAGIPDSMLAKSNAKKEAKDMFNQMYMKEAKKVAVKGKTPYDLGREVQGEIGKTYIDVNLKNQAKQSLKNKLLADATVSGNELGRVFSQYASKSILNESGDIISTLASPAQRMAGVADLKLSDIVDQDISFSNFEEVIRLISDKAQDANVNKSASANSYKTLRDNLLKLRDKVVSKSSPEAQNAFKDASDYFQDVVLKYREGSVGTAIKAEKGEHWNQSIALAASGKKAPMPKLVTDPSKVIGKAISNKTEIANTLRATNNSPVVLNAMRTEFLASRGIVKDSPIPKDAFNFSRQDIDVIDALWPKTEKGGVNRKYQTLNKIKNLADKEEGFVESMTNEALEKLKNENTYKAEQEILSLTKNEKELKDKQKKLSSNYLIKMWGSGKVPLPDNQTTMETFISGIRSASPLDQSKFLKSLEEGGKKDMFERAVINDLVKRVQSTSPQLELGSKGQVMWDHKTMKKALSGNEEYYKRFLGKDKYDNLVKWNNALKWSSVAGRPVGGVRIGFTKGAGEGPPNWYMSNIHIPVANRFKSAIVAAQLKSPIPARVLLSPESHDKWMERVIRWTFISDQGIEAIMNEAENDPEFKEWATGFYRDAFTESMDK